MDNYGNSYVILGINKTDDQEIIKQGYKKMIKKYHPDKNKGIDTTTQFIKIQKAYEILSDPLKKRDHDSKILLQEKKSKYNQSRNQMINDLIHKEKNSNKERTMTNRKRQREEFFDNKTYSLNTVQKPINSIELLQIKMNKEKAFDFSKEFIDSYFKQYGIIEDILIINGKSKDNKIMKKDFKALIFFKYNPKIDQIILKTLLDVNIRQLFELKKKRVTMEKYNKKKIKYRGEEHIGRVLFNKDESNKIQSTIKTEKMINNIINTHNENMNVNDTINKEKEVKENINFTSISLEAFEKAVFG